MQNYSQPSFYHFNEDSIELVEAALDNLDNKPKRILDLCAGSGVVGIDFIQKSSFSIEEIFFLEKQTDFESHIKTNCERFIPNVSSKIIIQNLQDFQDSACFDLILCNPPYFPKESNRPSQNLKRDICRQFSGKFQDDLLDFVEKNLVEGGKAFVLSPLELLSNSNFLIQELKNLKHVKVFSLQKVSNFGYEER